MKPISKLVLLQVGLKKPIVLLATSGIGVGVLGEIYTDTFYSFVGKMY